MIHPNAKIHPTALVEEGAVIGEDVVIGPFLYCLKAPLKLKLALY